MAVAAADLSKPSPWLSVWRRPRDTVERIVATNPKHHVLLLAALAGISLMLMLPLLNDDGFSFTTELLDWRLLTIGAIVAIGGAILGIVNLYVSAVLLSWSGRMLGGRASPAVMRAVLAWGYLPLILGEPSELRQIFVNLLLNALDAMSKGGAIRIAGKAIPDAVVVTIEDEGPGIPYPDDDRGPLFQLFRRSHLSGDAFELMQRRILVVAGIA